MLENSKVMCPSHSGSKGVTLQIIPQRAYVLLPTQTTRMSRGIRRYSTERASAKLFGGMTQLSPLKIHETLFIEILRVNNCAVYVGEDLEFTSTPNVVTVARSSVADKLLRLVALTKNKSPVFVPWNSVAHLS